jgi:hypothetical protein
MKRRLLLTTILLVVTMSNAQKIQSSIEQIYDGNSYINDKGKNYDYNSNGKLVSETSFWWNVGSNPAGWSPSSKKSYTYNSNGKVVEKLILNWNGYQHIINSSKDLYEYDNSGRIIKATYQEWNNDQWENSDQVNISYDNNKLTEAIIKKWEGTGWILDGRNTATYTDNKLTEGIEEDFVNGEYVNKSRITITYHNNFIKTSKKENWSIFSDWQLIERKEYVLDQSGNRTSETFISSSNDNYRIEYSYDASSFLEDFYHPFEEKTGFDYFSEDFPYVNKIISQTKLHYNSLTNDYDVPSRRITYDYDNSITPLSTKNFEGVNNVNVYPNPSNEFILISGLQKNENIKIYDVLGKVAKEKSVMPNQKIDIQDLNNGIYFLKIENRHTLKLVKK